MTAPQIKEFKIGTNKAVIDEENKKIEMIVDAAGTYTISITTDPADATCSPAAGETAVTLGTTNYTVTKGAESATYAVTFKTSEDANKVENIQHVGWFAARCFTGTIDAYPTGGFALSLGNFKPKFVVSVVIDGGFMGFYNISTNKLKVYKKANGEALATDLNGTKYSVILME